MLNLFYRVNNHLHFNLYTALFEAMESNSAVELYCKDTEYDLYDWSIEPAESLDQLMLAHANNLRNQYEKLVLFYSGGYDSQTIYNVFAKNQIHLDAIIVGAAENINFFPMTNYHWVKQNHWDPHTAVILVDAGDAGQNPMFDKSDWLTSNQGPMIRYHNSNFASFTQAAEKLFPNSEIGCINGIDKPRLVFRNDRWFHRMPNVVVDHLMNRPGLEAFFFDPKIAIKQAHLLKQNTKQWIKSNNLPLYNNDWAEAKFATDRPGLHAFNMACGRHAELSSGTSWLQKSTSTVLCGIADTNQPHTWTDIESTSPKSRFLINDIKQDKNAAKNFLRGVYGLLSEQRFIKWLTDKQMFKPSGSNPLYDLKFIWTKERDVGP